MDWLGGGNSRKWRQRWRIGSVMGLRQKAHRRTPSDKVGFVEKVEKVVGEGSTRRGVLLDNVHIEAFSSLADAQSGNLVGGRVFIRVLLLQKKTAISDLDLLRSNKGTA